MQDAKQRPVSVTRCDHQIHAQAALDLRVIMCEVQDPLLHRIDDMRIADLIAQPDKIRLALFIQAEAQQRTLIGSEDDLIDAPPDIAVAVMDAHDVRIGLTGEDIRVDLSAVDLLIHERMSFRSQQRAADLHIHLTCLFQEIFQAAERGSLPAQIDKADMLCLCDLRAVILLGRTALLRIAVQDLLPMRIQQLLHLRRIVGTEQLILMQANFLQVRDEKIQLKLMQHLSQRQRAADAAADMPVEEMIDVALKGEMDARGAGSLDIDRIHLSEEALIHLVDDIHVPRRK